MKVSKILIVENGLTDAMRSVLSVALNEIMLWLSASTQKIRIEFSRNNYDMPLTLKVGTVLTGNGNTPVTSSYIDPYQIAVAGKALEVQNKEDYNIVFLIYNSDTLQTIPGIPHYSVHSPIYQDGFTIAQTGLNLGAMKEAVAEIIMHETLHSWYTLIRNAGIAITDETHQFGGMSEARDEYNYRQLVFKLEPYYKHIAVDGEVVPYDGRADALHKSLLGKYILRPEAHGEMYRVEATRLLYEPIGIKDPILKKEFDDFLRGPGKILGVSEENFDILTSKLPIENP